MDMEDFEEAAPQLPQTRGRHIKKRALKNKALSVSFNEKDLKDFVTGFHKRKKKRRKEAQKQQEEVLRRKRIEGRKKRKLEREFALYGVDPPVSGSTPSENEDDEEAEPIASVAGTKMYDNGDIKVTVTTREISREEEETLDGERTHSAIPRSTTASSEKKKIVPVPKTKSSKKVVKHKRRSKPHGKRDKKGSKRNKKGL